MKYENGQIWKAPFPFLAIALLQVLPGGQFCLLAYEDRARHGGARLNAITDPDGSGKWQYSYGELEARLKEWSLLAGDELMLVKNAATYMDPADWKLVSGSGE